MKEFFNLSVILKDKIIFRSFSLAFFLLLTTIIFIAFSYRNLPPVVPVFTQMPWGDSRLGSTPFIFLSIAFALLLIVCNMFISAYMHKKNPLLSRIIAVTSVLIVLLSTVFSIRIVSLIL